jgi:hypothetical protein
MVRERGTGQRKRDAAAAAGFSNGSGGAMATGAPPASIPTEPDSAERKAARKRWANLIRHIYEVDPLVCPRCGGAMKIISFITEQRVIHAILDSVQRTGRPSPAGSLHPPPSVRPAGNGVQ